MVGLYSGKLETETMANILPGASLIAALAKATQPEVRGPVQQLVETPPALHPNGQLSGDLPVTPRALHRRRRPGAYRRSESQGAGCLRAAGRRGSPAYPRVDAALPRATGQIRPRRLHGQHAGVCALGLPCPIRPDAAGQRTRRNNRHWATTDAGTPFKKCASGKLQSDAVLQRP